MPSPFPGMDPWLERPGGWLNVHNRFVTYLADALDPQIAPRYVALTTERVYVVTEDRSVYPDVSLVETLTPPRSRGASRMAVAEHDAPIIVRVPFDTIREAAVDVLEAATGLLVTGIEVTSSSNKAPGPGREQYDRKRREIADRGASFVEIDLLRAGRRNLACPEERLATLAPFDYLICVRRRSAQDELELYPAPLRQRLPRIAIPLLDDDPDAVVDLNAVLESVYDRSGYARTIDYRATPPSPALSAEDTQWVDALLRERGLR